MVDTAHCAFVIGKSFEMRFHVISVVVDAGKTCNFQVSKFNDICSSKIVDVVSNPSSVEQFEKMITGFMIATNEDSEVGSNFFAIVVLVKVGQSSILCWHSSDIEVLVMSYCLFG